MEDLMWGIKNSPLNLVSPPDIHMVKSAKQLNLKSRVEKVIRRYRKPGETRQKDKLILSKCSSNPTKNLDNNTFLAELKKVLQQELNKTVYLFISITDREFLLLTGAITEYLKNEKKFNLAKYFL